jgi:hypothetical protein
MFRMSYMSIWESHKLLSELSVSFHVIPQHINSNDPFYCDLSTPFATICTGVATGTRYQNTFTRMNFLYYA